MRVIFAAKDGRTVTRHSAVPCHPPPRPPDDQHKRGAAVSLPVVSSDGPGSECIWPPASMAVIIVPIRHRIAVLHCDSRRDLGMDRPLSGTGTVTRALRGAWCKPRNVPMDGEDENCEVWRAQDKTARHDLARAVPWDLNVTAVRVGSVLDTAQASCCLSCLSSVLRWQWRYTNQSHTTTSSCCALSNYYSLTIDPE